MRQKLYRSRTDCMIAGVCGGLGEYFGIDSSLVRVGTVLLMMAGGAGIIAYVVLWLIVPQKSLASSLADDAGAPAGKAEAGEYEGAEKDKAVLVVGSVLTILGILLLMNNYLPFSWLSFRKLWPLLIIFAGILIIMKGSGGKEDEG